MRTLTVLVCLVSATMTGAAEPTIQRFALTEGHGQPLAVRIDNADLVYSSQLFPEVDAGEELAGQLASLKTKLQGLLKAVDARAVKLNVYVAIDSDAETVTREFASLFAEGEQPAMSWVSTALPVSGARVAVDFVAARVSKASIVSLSDSASGPATYAVMPAGASSRAFVSGQAEKGDGTLPDATRLTMASLFRTLDFLEMEPGDVLQVKAFVMPMSKSDDVLAAIRDSFAPAKCPPVVLVEWNSPSLPIEIELVAASMKPLTQARPVLEYLTPPEMKPSPVYCKVVRVQSPSTIFLSGLYGAQADPDSEAELRELFQQTQTLAERSGSDLRHLVKATYYVSSAGSSQQHNKLRPEYYDPARPPAASKAIVAGVGRPGRTITWDMIAVPKGAD